VIRTRRLLTLTLCVLLAAACTPTPPTATPSPTPVILDLQVIRPEDVPEGLEAADLYDLAVTGTSSASLAALPPFSSLTLARPRNLVVYRAPSQTLMGLAAYPLTQADAALVDALLADPAALGQAFAGEPAQSQVECAPAADAPAGVTAADCRVNTQARAEGSLQPNRFVAGFREGAVFVVLQSLYDEREPANPDAVGFAALAGATRGRLVPAVQAVPDMAAPRANVAGNPQEAVAEALRVSTRVLSGWPEGYADRQQLATDFTHERLVQFGPRLRSYAQVAKPGEATVQLYVIYPPTASWRPPRWKASLRPCPGPKSWPPSVTVVTPCSFRWRARRRSSPWSATARRCWWSPCSTRRVPRPRYAR
jgi:hypothetical protein